jgi:hypothetical protein
VLFECTGLSPSDSPENHTGIEDSVGAPPLAAESRDSEIAVSDTAAVPRSARKRNLQLLVFGESSVPRQRRRNKNRGRSETKRSPLKNFKTILLRPLNSSTARSVLMALKRKQILLLMPANDPQSSQMLFRMHLLFVNSGHSSWCVLCLCSYPWFRR